MRVIKDLSAEFVSSASALGRGIGCCRPFPSPTPLTNFCQRPGTPLIPRQGVMTAGCPPRPAGVLRVRPSARVVLLANPGGPRRERSLTGHVKLETLNKRSPLTPDPCSSRTTKTKHTIVTGPKERARYHGSNCPFTRRRRRAWASCPAGPSCRQSSENRPSTDRRP